MRYTIHNTVQSGRKVRVFVNGNEVQNCIIADTDKGEVLFYPKPIRIKKSTDEVYARKLIGVVTVEDME